jgi:hypothetical protein
MTKAVGGRHRDRPDLLRRHFFEDLSDHQDAIVHGNRIEQQFEADSGSAELTAEQTGEGPLGRHLAAAGAREPHLPPLQQHDNIDHEGRRHKPAQSFDARGAALLTQFESIGDQESGFLAAELSPCEELLVLATGANTLVMFDKEFNILDEKPLDDEDGTPKDFKIELCRIAWRFDSNVPVSS